MILLSSNNRFLVVKHWIEIFQKLQLIFEQYGEDITIDLRDVITADGLIAIGIKNIMHIKIPCRHRLEICAGINTSIPIDFEARIDGHIIVIEYIPVETQKGEAFISPKQQNNIKCHHNCHKIYEF